MTYENVEMSTPNMTGDRNNGYFYSFASDSGVISMNQYNKNTPLDPINATIPTNEDIVNEVVCCQFDGYYYWTLERNSNGITIRKWELISNILYRVGIFSFSDSFSITYDSYCFSVDSYNSYLSESATLGTGTLEVDDGTVFSPGDEVVLGPSTNVSFTGEYETAVIDSVSDNTLNLSSVLTKSFGASDKVYTSRYFYVFNKYSPYDDSKGCILKYDIQTGILNEYSPSHMFGDVRSACFYSDYILFVKGNDVIFINPETLSIYKYMAIDNLDLNRADNVVIESIWVYSDVLYALQNKKVYFDDGEDSWEEEDWGSKYNYVTHSLVSYAYFIDLKAEPNIIHAVAAPGVPTTTSNITVKVLDQYRVPILGGVYVSFTTSHGTLTPSSGTTDSDTGELTVTYNGTSDITDVRIKAEIV